MGTRGGWGYHEDDEIFLCVLLAETVGLLSGCGGVGATAEETLGGPVEEESPSVTTEVSAAANETAEVNENDAVVAAESDAEAGEAAPTSTPPKPLERTENATLFHIKIVDEKEKPLAGTVVNILTDRGETFFSAASPEDGVITLLLPLNQKFKVKFVEKPEEEEAKATMDLIRKEFAGQINSSINSIKMQNIREMEQGFLSQQQGLFDYKVKFFTEIPVFVMSLEQFGTLESIEEYLLNKLEGKGDLDYQGIFNHYVKSLKQNQKKNELEKLKQVQTQENQIRGQSGKEGEEEEEGDEEQLEVEEVEQAQKKIMTASKEETIWDNTVKRKMSQQESKIDLMDQMRKDKL